MNGTSLLGSRAAGAGQGRCVGIVIIDVEFGFILIGYIYFLRLLQSCSSVIAVAIATTQWYSTIQHSAALRSMHLYSCTFPIHVVGAAGGGDDFEGLLVHATSYDIPSCAKAPPKFDLY